MLSNLKTLFDSIKSGLSFSQRRTVLQSDASSSQFEQKHGLDDFISNRHSDSGERFSISRWDSLEGLEEVGHGAFGVVYRAWDPVLRRYVALKLFRADEGQIEEARKLAQVNSPNIVKIFRFETHEGYPGFTMEFIEGLTLADEIEQGAPLDCKAAAAIGIDLCKAVSAVHSAGLLHRDIKAQNVMREASGRIVLMDFGLGENMNNLGVGDSLAGTLPYMAPELFVGARASVNTDVYSLGVLLYFLVSGEYPVSANEISGFRKAHVNGLRVPLRENHRSMNRGFARIVGRATTADPRQRFASAEELAQALVRWRAMRSRKRVWVIVPAVAAVVAAAFYATRAPAIEEFRLKKKITTDDGVSMEPSLSADGLTVAYTSDASGRGDFDIWVRRVDGSSVRRVTDSPAHEDQPTLSPDGKQVAYRVEGPGGGIYIRGVDGGQERLLSQSGLTPKFSPDGKEIVFWTGSDAQFESETGRIYIIPAAGGPPRQLVPDFKDARLPTWSPDGNEILFQGCGPGCNDPERETDWWRVRRDGSNPRPTGALRDALEQGLTLYLSPPVWRQDSILFSARMEHETNLWEIPISKPFWVFHRNAIPRTTSTEEGVEPSIAADGSVAFTGLRVRVNLWRAKIQRQAVEEGERTTQNVEIDSMPSVSARGDRLLYFRRIGNSRKMILRDGQGNDILSRDVPPGTRGIISASGEVIAYSSPIQEVRRIFVMQAPSWTPLMISQDAGEVLDIFDRDHRLLVTVNAGVASLDISSGQRTVLLQDSTSSIDQAQVSPDGKWITFLRITDSSHSQIYIAPMRASLIKSEEWILITDRSAWHDTPRWTRNGQSIVFLSDYDGFMCIWRLTLGPGMQPKGDIQPIIHLHKGRISPMHLSRVAFNMGVTQDSIIYNAAEYNSNIWLAQ